MCSLQDFKSFFQRFFSSKPNRQYLRQEAQFFKTKENLRIGNKNKRIRLKIRESFSFTTELKGKYEGKASKNKTCNTITSATDRSLLQNDDNMIPQIVVTNNLH